jgi:predicted nucleic acid-binding protein
LTQSYWDTSAILKLYAPERDSPYFLDLVGRTERPIYSSSIAEVELLCALHRKERDGDLKPGGASALHRRFRLDCHAGRILLVPYGGDVVQEAANLMRITFARRAPAIVRSLDLIHLASASVVKATALVATDQRVRGFGSVLKLQLLP